MSEFKFRSGKHQGKTLEEVQRVDPSYIEWVKENQPNMLKPTIKYNVPAAKPVMPQPRKEPPEESEEGNGRLPENTDFLNQGPNGKLT